MIGVKDEKTLPVEYFDIQCEGDRVNYAQILR